MNVLEILKAIFTVYIIGVVIAHGSILEPARYRIKKFTPWLKLVPGQPHFIECRLCINFWISIAVCYGYGLDLSWLLPIYGAASYMSVLER